MSQYIVQFFKFMQFGSFLVCGLDDSDDDLKCMPSIEEVRKGDFSYLSGHPEDFLQPEVMEMLRKAL
jgi:hypothetical protein